MLNKFLLGIAAIALVACGAESTSAQASKTSTSKTDANEAAAPKQDITTQELGGGFYMLLGPGGNIGVSVGDDGVFVIDDKSRLLVKSVPSQMRLFAML